MNVAHSLYSKLPVWGQHGAVTAFGVYWHVLRFGPGYRRCVREYLARERFTAPEWAAWQREEVKKLLAVAVDRVPYYRSSLSPDQKRAALAGRLEALPLLEKDALRQDVRAFLRGDRRRPLFAFPTSGTTGTPILSYFTARELRQSIALREARSARWAGVSFSEPRATFSGRMVEPDPESPGPYYRFNAIERQVYLSPFHLRPGSARLYVRALHRHRPRWLTGYAVSCYLLARFILEQGLDVPPLRAVITTSEKLTREMSSLMERAYGCRVWQEYSTVENAVFGSECEAGRLHVSPDVAVVEILREDGSPCGPGEVGEVVTTSLTHWHQILVRFRLGDLAAWDPNPCPCGRAMPVLEEVTGRVEDVVIGPDGRRMVRFHGVFTQGVRVAQGQIVQEALDRIRVRIVPAEGYDDADTREIARRVQERLGNSVGVAVELVSQIFPAGSGKVPAVVSLLRECGVAQAERIGCRSSEPPT